MSILLSIMYPAFNRSDLLKLTLINTCENIKNYSELIEVIVSDNSQNNLNFNVFQEIKNLYPKLNLKYSKNVSNFGFALNYLRLIELSNAKFIWIIGDDDFIKPYSIDKILKYLIKNYDFLIINFDTLNLNLLDSFSLIKDKLVAINHLPNLKSTRINLKHDLTNVDISETISHKFHNVFLGAFMTNIFKKSKLTKYINEIKGMNLNTFDTLFSMYPNTFFILKLIFNSNGVYSITPLITVGGGKREWGTDFRKKLFESSIPRIYLKIIPYLLNLYHKKENNFLKLYFNRLNISYYTGYYASYLIFNPIYIIKIYNNYKELIIYLFPFLFIPNFYFGLLRGIVKNLYLLFRNLI